MEYNFPKFSKEISNSKSIIEYLPFNKRKKVATTKTKKKGHICMSQKLVPQEATHVAQTQQKSFLMHIPILRPCPPFSPSHALLDSPIYQIIKYFFSWNKSNNNAGTKSWHTTAVTSLDNVSCNFLIPFEKLEQSCIM